MRERPQWGLAWGKQPTWINRHGRHVSASSTDTGTWMEFGCAVREARARDCDLGFFLHPGDGLACVDLDVKNHINEPDKPEVWTTAPVLARMLALCEELDSYTELSRSGQGAHVWCYGKTGAGVNNRKAGVEVYSQWRFMAVTGHTLHGAPVADRHRYLSDLVEALRAHKARHAAGDEEAALADDVVLGMFWKGDKLCKFASLWRGEWAALGYPSQSEADAALIKQLHFYTRSSEQVTRLFRMSALGQRRKAYRDSYMEWTLGLARAGYAERWAAEDAMLAQRPAIDAAIDQALRERALLRTPGAAGTR